MTARAVPFHCPYCADEDLRPHGEKHGEWECRSCLRAFKLNFIGQLAPPNPRITRKEAHIMTAPALIALAHGSRDPRSAATINALTELVACMRPDLRVETAFLDLAEPSFDEAVDRLVAEGHQEIVVVPLLLSEAYHARVDVPAAIEAAVKRHDGIQVHATRVLGMESAFFHVLDKRLREALSKNRVRELDALVLAGAGSSDPIANAAISRAARAWGAHHKLPTIAAFASSVPPAAGEAVRQHRADGRRHIAVGMLFLAPGVLPDRVAELAHRGRRRCGRRAAWRRRRGGPGHPGSLRRRRCRPRPARRTVRLAPLRASCEASDVGRPHA